MIQKGTILKVIDNSGAKEVSCIHISKGYRQRYAKLGDIILVSIKSLRSKRRIASKVKKGDILHALIVRTKKNKILTNYEFLEFFENAVILVSAQKKLIGTRIFGSVPTHFRGTKFSRILSLSSSFIK